MQFCGLTIITDKEFSKRIVAAKAEQRMVSNTLVEKLLYDAERYRILAKGKLGREVKLPPRPH
jgi:hypothetical protein